MNVIEYGDGTVKLTSGNGAVRDVLSGRTWKEVVCRKDEAWRYSDGRPEERTVRSSAVEYSKYRIMRKCQELGVWDSVKARIEAAGLLEAWNTILVVRSDDPQFASCLPAIREEFGAETVDGVLRHSVAE